jgi:hydroxymethylbilane synthase
LALRQTQYVIDALAAAAPDITCVPVVISTHGDRDKQTPLASIGGQGIFAKELQRAILDGEIDCAVHSVKDLTSTMPDGLTLAAILEREDPRDVLVSRHSGGLAGLPPGARVGSSSPRRQTQLRLVRSDIEPVELRGNLDTRLRKVLDDRECDAAILAAAGLIRMGVEERISEYLDVSAFTPAPGQGAIGVDCRAGDRALRALLASITDSATRDEVEAERAFLREIGGGCRSPLAAHARVESDLIRMWAMFANETATRIATAEDEADREDGVALAESLAQRLMEQVTG